MLRRKTPKIIPCLSSNTTPHKQTKIGLVCSMSNAGLNFLGSSFPHLVIRVIIPFHDQYMYMHDP